MSNSSPQGDRSYTNVMESLVAEEVVRQKGQLPPKLREYIKTVEVETYALNRLPALYASSEKGWQMQYEKAGQANAEAISRAVRQGVAAVQIDPLRASEPLCVHQSDESETVLTAFRNMLNQPKLTWDDILYKCKRLLLPRDHPDRPALKDDSQHRAFWQPSTHGGAQSWEKSREALSHSSKPSQRAVSEQAVSDRAVSDRAVSELAEGCAWADPRYRQ